MNEKMKAVVITEFGGVDVLEIGEVEKPSIKNANDVLVRVRAAALNRADLLQRRGRYPAPKGFPQEIPGLEFAGEVVAVSDDVSSLKIGDRVFGITGGAAQAEFVCANENELAIIPENLNWVEAAAIPEAFITAHDALITQAKLKKGESVLIHAVGSGVGLAAVQLAKAFGAFCCGTSRTEDKIERVKMFGLDNGVVVDEPSQFVDSTKSWTQGMGANVILDLVGGNYFPANLDALALKGRLVLIGTTAGAKAEFEFFKLMAKRATIIGTVLRSRSSEEKAEATKLFANDVIPLLAKGSVRPVIDSVFEIKDARKAHERLESNETFGKVVLRLGACR
jgi:putative PIG3 family NAD(P)H quinone oxidoreductase